MSARLVSAALLGGAVLLNVLSYLLYKAASLRMEQRVLYWVLVGAGLALGVGNIFFYNRALRGLDQSTAYPVFSAACVLFVALGSAALFHESLGPQKLLGIVLILLGVFFVSR